MDDNLITIFFSGQILCLLLIIGSFVAWFQLRETPRGDLACSVVASCAAALLFVSIWAL
jgi:hypothetical protein